MTKASDTPVALINSKSVGFVDRLALSFSSLLGEQTSVHRFIKKEEET